MFINKDQRRCRIKQIKEDVYQQGSKMLQIYNQRSCRLTKSLFFDYCLPAYSLIHNFIDHCRYSHSFIMAYPQLFFAKSNLCVKATNTCRNGSMMLEFLLLSPCFQSRLRERVKLQTLTCNG